jgi:Zn-finger nucleic acid-binding protein
MVVEREEIEVDWCLACHGLWFDEGELELLGEKAGRVLDVEDLGRRSGRVAAAGKRRCPRCPRRLERLDFDGPEGARVVVDRCAQHGFWLDQGELGLLMRRLEKRTETNEGLVIEFLGETFVGGVDSTAPSEGRQQ